MKKIIHVVGGGTSFHVRPHLALSAPSYGTLAKQIEKHLQDQTEYEVRLRLTKMAGGDLETNEDVANYIDNDVLAEPRSRILFLTSALCDWTASVQEDVVATLSGKDQPRLRTDNGDHTLLLHPAEKVLMRVRSKEAPKPRKDVFLVACKTTAGASDEEMYARAVEMMKRSSANLVLANDVQRRRNMIVCPEQAAYFVTDDRDAVVKELVSMTLARSHATFTRTNVLPEKRFIEWADAPAEFREVVDYAISQGAYRPNALGVTVGHFAWKWDVSSEQSSRTLMYSSRRRRDFNKMEDRDLVRVERTGEIVDAFGALPSAGARSQMILFDNHPEFDYVIHFHCPLREGHDQGLQIQSQREFECGSHECGANTSHGIKTFMVNQTEIGAVMLDNHGPNILFKKGVRVMDVVGFIERNFDLSKQTSENLQVVAHHRNPDMAVNFEKLYGAKGDNHDLA